MYCKMPYPLSSSKGYGGGAGSSGLGYSSIPSTSYLPGFSSVVFGGHNFSSGRSPLYGGSSAGSLGLLGLSSYSMPSLPTYSHVSPYAAASTGYVTYGGYSSAATTGPKSYYSPLPTISEHSSGASSSNRRRGQKTYIPVLPLPTDAGNRPAFYTSAGVKTLYTEDIDVTTPRKTATPSEIARKRSGEGFGTIRRGRTVIRLETKKLKESPYVPQENGEQKETPATTEDAKPKEKESTVQNTTIPLISEPEKPSDTAAAAVTREVAEDTTAPTKDYSQVSKWYEEEIRKPMKKEKNAGDKFREKYMVRSRKSKHAGYRRPTLSDIRAQKAVVMKEIEERLKKLTDATPPGQAVPEEMKVEAEKLEKDKERLARLDKKMARRFSRALKKAVGTGEAESSDDESLCVDRQATVKSGRKLSSVTISADLPALCDGEDGAGSIQSQRLTRKQTKRFFFPQEASSVVQPEIIDTSAYAEPQDLFEKNILAQRQTIKTRATQKKCAVINQRKSSASDLEIPTNVLSDKICDVEAKTLEPPEELSEEGKPPTPPTKSAPGSANTSGKKKKLVKKAGDPPAKRVPGNILQPLVVPPKDSDSILESPTEEEIESSKQSKKNSIGKVNGLVGNAQQGLKSPFLKNNLLGKPKPLVAPPNKLNKQPNKLTNDTTAAATGVGALPGKKIGEVKPKEEKPSSNTSSLNSKTSNDNKALAVKPVAELSSAAAVSSIINAEQTKQMTESVPTVVTVTAPSSQDKKLGGDEKASEAGKPIINETKTTTPPTLKNDKADSEKSDEKLNEGKKVAANEETKNPRGKNVAAEKEKVLPAVAKLKPKLALDNKSTSLDGLKPKLKLDGKSASFDANDDKKAGGADKGAADGKKPLMKQEAPANKKPVAPVAVKMAEKPKDAATTESAKTDKAQVESEKKTSNPPTDGKVPETQSKSANVEISAKGPTPVPKKELAHVDKKENSKPTEENLKPIKKVDEPEKLVKEQVAEVKQQQNNLKKVSPAADNESLAKQDLLPVKVEEKKQEKPKKVEAATSQELAAKLETKSEATQKNVAKTGNKKQEPAIVPKAKLEEKKVESTSPIKDKIEQQKKELAQKENKDEKKVDSATPTPLKGKPEEKKIEPQGEKIEAKTESPSSKAEPQDEKQKAGVKSPPAQQKVVPVPLQLKEKLGIKSPPLSPKLKDTGKKATTDALNPSADKKDLPQQQVSKVVNESKPVPVETKENETTALKEKSLPNGHLSPSPPSSPKGKGAAKPAPPNKQQAQKSPQTNEATQKDGGITKFADSNDVRSAKVENLGCNAEMTTNGPEKGKNDSAPAIPDGLPDNSAQMNKVGNLSTASASENLATVPPQSIEGNSGQKLDSVTITNTVASNEKSSVDNTGNTDATDAIKSKSTEDATAVAEPLHSSARQSLIRKSLKRGSPRHSSESSISSSGSSTSTAKTGMTPLSIFFCQRLKRLCCKYYMFVYILYDMLYLLLTSYCFILHILII